MRQLTATFYFAHRPTVFDGFLRQLQLVNHMQGQQRTGMPHFQTALIKHFLNRLGQTQQAQAVGDGTTAFTDGFCDGFMSQAKFVSKTFQTLSFFNRIEVFTLQVFNQTHGQRGFVADGFDNDGNFGQTGQLGSAPTAFAGNQFILRQTTFAYDNRLDNALCLNGIGQLLQSFVINLHTRLITAGLNIGDGNRCQAVATATVHCIGNQRIQTASQSTFCFCHIVFPFRRPHC